MKLRNIQILLVIILLEKPTKVGRLAQVLTGEGKTIVLAMLSAI